MARFREATRYGKFLNLRASTDPEAEMFQLQFYAGLQDGNCKLNIFVALRGNDNLAVEKLLQLIQYRNQTKRIVESSIFLVNVECGCIRGETWPR